MPICGVADDLQILMITGDGGFFWADVKSFIVVHLGKEGKPLFLEVLNASKNVPLMVQALAKKEVAA